MHPAGRGRPAGRPHRLPQGRALPRHRLGQRAGAHDGLGPHVDLGAFCQGNPDVKPASVGCTTSAAVCKALASDVAAQALHLRGDVDGYKVYPVVHARIGCRF